MRTDTNSVIAKVKFAFGPHHFVELNRREDGGVDLVMGSTHHGLLADASIVTGELEGIISEVHEAHPDLAVD